MQTPKLDGRDRRDIMDQLKALARSYVPEWRWMRNTRMPAWFWPMFMLP